MFTIGEFSRINKISTRMLRHYDKINLLKPVKIDKWTNYRYYSIEQIDELKKILLLKDIGVPLKTIVKIKKNNYKDIETILKEQKTHLITEIENYNLKISILNNLYNNINNIEKLNYNIEILLIPEIYVYSKKYILSHAIPTKIEHLIIDLKKEIESKNIIPSGYPIILWYNEEFNPEESKLEIAIPISDKKYFTNILKEHLFACVAYKDEFDKILSCYTYLYNWINTNNYKAKIPIREIRYNYHDFDKLEHLLTLIMIPIEKK